MKKYKRFFIHLIFFMIGLSLTGGRNAIVSEAKTVEIQLEVVNGEDITEKLQDALDMNRYNNGNLCKITIPAGKYKIGGGGIKVYSNTYLSMKGVTLIRTVNEITMIRFGRSSDMDAVGGYSRYNGFHDITIEGGVWNGGGKKGQILRGAHAQNLTFKNVVFTNVSSGHHMELAACKNVLFSGCTFSNFTGKLDLASQNCEALQFDVIHSSSQYPNYGRWDDTPCQNITVDHCVFSNLERGIGSHTAVAGSYFNKVNITNNVFKNIKGYAITGLNYRNSKINNNTIKNCGSGILFRSMVKNHIRFLAPLNGKIKIQKDSKSEIKNNKIEVKNKGYAATNFGISLYGENVKKSGNLPIGDFRLAGVTVEKNTINLKSKGYGIWLQGVEKSKILNNTITCHILSGNKTGKGDGIRLVESSGNTLCFNKITNKKKTGIASEMCGISIIEKSNNNNVRGNIVENASKDGIAIKKSSNVVLRANRVSKSGRYGINITDNSKVQMSKDNVVKGSKKRDKTCTRGARINGNSSIK